MPIRVKCPKCHRRFKVENRHSGKRKRCPYCQDAHIEIPIRVDPAEIPKLRTESSTSPMVGTAPTLPASATGTSTHGFPWVLFAALSVGTLVVIILIAVVIASIPPRGEEVPSDPPAGEASIEPVSTEPINTPPVVSERAE